MDGQKDLELAYLAPKATKEKSRLRPMHPVVDHGSETVRYSRNLLNSTDNWSLGRRGFEIVIRYFPTEFPTICTKHRRITIRVNPIAIAEVRNLYAPPDHDVFELVPRDFAIIVGQIYQQLGQPSVTRTNGWDVYMDILTRFQHLDSLHGVPAERDKQWGYALTMARDD
ncbi:hypothetical protein B0H14DRAFT_2587571 [Mycena olivaceomarginata]|nr:hypothetical protein B0H14DRAFT_2587571 [Mycena olivaceomarginata]